MAKRPHLSSIALLILVLASLAAAEVLTIDFADDQGPATYRASGFLGGLSPSQPHDSLIAPLKPKLFRDGAGYAQVVYSRVKSFGAKAQMCLSLTRERFNPMPGTNNDWSAWENHVRTTVSNAKSSGQIYEWDIWNEPNGAEFWTASLPQFYETWRRAVVIIRSLDPNAVIVGPSIANFDFTYLKNFLQYAKTNNVLPTAVCWHEINGLGTVRGIAMNVQAMRTYMAGQGMNIQKIYINEMTSSLDMYNPGLIVRHIAAVEHAKIDGACKSCWNESDGTNNCYFLLDGIVTHGSPQYPRSAWWAYKSYADITGRLVGVVPAPTPFYLDGVAGQDASKGEARAVLGRHAGTGRSFDVKLINLGSVPYLTRTGTIRVVAKRIPNSGEARLISPTTMIDANYSVSNNTLQFTISDFPDSAAYAIQFTPIGTPAIQEMRMETEAADWKVYQSNRNARIFVLGDDFVSVSVHDLRGRLIHEVSSHSKEAVWDASKHSPGIYLFRFKTKTGVFQKKVAMIP